MDTRVCLIGARTHLLISHCFGGYALCVMHSPMVTLVAFQRYLILSSLIVNPLPLCFLCFLSGLLALRVTRGTRICYRLHGSDSRYDPRKRGRFRLHLQARSILNSQFSIINLPPFTVHRHHSQFSIINSQFNPFPVHCPILPQFQLDRYQSGKYLKIS